jgi:hypothetical protein
MREALTANFEIRRFTGGPNACIRVVDHIVGQR